MNYSTILTNSILEQCSSLSQRGILWRSLQKLSNISQISPTIGHFLDELYGDSSAMLVLLQQYEILMKNSFDSNEKLIHYQNWGHIKYQVEEFL